MARSAPRPALPAPAPGKGEADVPEWRLWGRLALAVAAGALLAWLLLASSDALFRVDARSDAVDIKVGDARFGEWSAGLLVSAAPADCEVEAFRPQVDALVSLRRQPGGAVLIDVQNAPGKAAGHFVCSGFGDSMASGELVQLKVPARQAGEADLVLPFRGALILGEPPVASSLTPALLRSARVIVETPASLLRAGRVDSQHEIDTGDTLEFADTASNGGSMAPATMVGFLLFDHDDGGSDASRGIRVVARGRAETALVGFHGAGEASKGVISPTLFGRIAASAEYLAFVPLLWLLAQAGQAIERLLDRRRDTGARRPRQAARFWRRRAPPAALLLFASLLLASPRAEAQLPVVEVEGDGGLGAGTLFQHPEGCRVLTALHVLGQGTRAKVAVPGRPPQMAALVWWHEADVAILALPASPGVVCPALVLPNIPALLETNPVGQVALPAVPPDLRRVPVAPTVGSGGLLEAAATIAGETRLVKGISGAPFLLGGSLAGVVQKVVAASQSVVLLRLDRIAELAGRNLVQAAPAAPGVPAVVLPYDLGWMPAAMQAAIREARADVDGAREAERRAFIVALAGEIAAARAIPLPDDARLMALPSGSSIRFDTNSGNTYAGEFTVDWTQTPRLITASGLGATIYTSGKAAGDRMAGRFENYLREGVRTMVANPANHNAAIRYAGEHQANGFWGPLGVHEGKFGFELGRFNRDIERGLLIRPNGERVEGSWGQTQANGWLVIWDKDGRFIVGGRYQAGTLVEPVKPPGG
jgi:hypothetical protein